MRPKLMNPLSITILLVGGFFLVSWLIQAPIGFGDQRPLANQRSTVPTVTFVEGQRSFVQINLDWEAAPYFNIYRAPTSQGPWTKIIDRFQASGHTAVDYDLPPNTPTLYYRITTVDDVGRESLPSDSTSTTIPGVAEKKSYITSTPVATVDTTNWQVFRDTHFGFEVKYPPGYIATTTYYDTNTYPLAPQGSIDFYKESDYKELTSDKWENGGKDAAFPGVGFSFFANPEKLSALEWAKKDDVYSNFSGTYVTVNVAGQKAISYSWEGIGGGDNLVFTKDGYDYVVRLGADYGSFSGADHSEVRKDFINTVSTFKFLK